MNRAIKVATFAFALALGPRAALAEAIFTDLSNFTVYAGGSFGTNDKAKITGLVGAASVWLGKETVVEGGVYSTGNVGADDKVRIKGRVIAGRSASFDKQTEIESTIHAQRDVWLDDKVKTAGIVGSTRVDIDKQAQVEGDVVYGTNVWIHSNAQVAGGVTQGTATPDAWVPPTMNMPLLNTGGGANQYFSKNSDQSLAPGSYGSLSVDKDSTLRLSAGTYTFSSMWLGKNVKLEADTSSGAVEIHILNDLSTDKDVDFDSSDELMALVVGRNASFGKENVIEAGLMASNNVHVSEKSKLYGQLLAGRNAWVDKQVEILGYNASLPMGGPTVATAPIPEPASFATLTLLVSAAFMIRSRPRRAA